MKVAIVMFAVVVVVAGRPLSPGHIYDRYALEWLAKTGWYPQEPNHVDDMSEESVEDDLLKYLPAMQDFYHTGGDGLVNKRTVETMRERNCANKDYGMKNRGNESRRRRSKRYAHLGGTWPRGATVTFGFEKYLSGLSKADQINVAKGCAKMWGDVSSLKFRLVNYGEELVNILISHERMDGPQGSVGWGESPRRGSTSRVTLDESDVWKARQLSSKKRASVYEEALCHEMGHALGLGHSQVSDAIMYHRVGSRNRNTRLHRDDINGIQSRYGSNTDGMSLVGSSVSTPEPITSEPDPFTSQPQTPQPFNPQPDPQQPFYPQPDPQQPYPQPDQPRTGFRPDTSRNSYRIECTLFGCRKVYTNPPPHRTTSTRSQRRPSGRRTRIGFPQSFGGFNFFR